MKSKHRLIWYALAVAGLSGLVFLLFLKSGNREPRSETPEPAPLAEPATAVESPTVAVPLPKADLDEAQRTAIKTKILELAANEKDPLEYEGRLEVMLRGYNREQLQALLDLARDGSLEPALAAAVRSVALNRWFEINPAEAVKLADSGLLGDQAGHWLDEKLTQWAQSSPAAAFDFIQANPLNGLPGESAYHSLARGAAWGGSREWVDRALAQETDPQQRIQTVTTVSQYLQQYHPDLVDDWIKGIPLAEQPRALAEAAKLQAEHDVPAAVQKLVDIWNSDLDPTYLFGTTGSILARWAEQSPTAAADWLVGQKMEKLSEAQREMLMATLLRVWARNATSPDGITAWLDVQVKAGRLDKAFLDRAMKRF